MCPERKLLAEDSSTPSRPRSNKKRVEEQNIPPQHGRLVQRDNNNEDGVLVTIEGGHRQKGESFL